jgi:hypothetical protein
LSLKHWLKKHQLQDIYESIVSYAEASDTDTPVALTFDARAFIAGTLIAGTSVHKHWLQNPHVKNICYTTFRCRVNRYRHFPSRTSCYMSINHRRIYCKTFVAEASDEEAPLQDLL